MFPPSPVYTAFRARAKRQRGNPALFLPTSAAEGSTPLQCSEVSYDALVTAADSVSELIIRRVNVCVPTSQITRSANNDRRRMHGHMHVMCRDFQTAVARVDASYLGENIFFDNFRRPSVSGKL